MENAVMGFRPWELEVIADDGIGDIEGSIDNMSEDKNYE